MFVRGSDIIHEDSITSIHFVFWTFLCEQFLWILVLLDPLTNWILSPEFSWYWYISILFSTDFQLRRRLKKPVSKYIPILPSDSVRRFNLLAKQDGTMWSVSIVKSSLTKEMKSWTTWFSKPDDRPYVPLCSQSTVCSYRDGFFWRNAREDRRFRSSASPFSTAVNHRGHLSIHLSNSL